MYIQFPELPCGNKSLFHEYMIRYRQFESTSDNYREIGTVEANFASFMMAHWLSYNNYMSDGWRDLPRSLIFYPHKYNVKCIFTMSPICVEQRWRSKNCYQWIWSQRGSSTGWRKVNPKNLFHAALFVCLMQINEMNDPHVIEFWRIAAHQDHDLFSRNTFRGPFVAC